MFEKAIEKLKAEMSKNNNPYIQVVGGFLIQHLNENPEVVEKILQEGKTIAKSLDEMRKAAEKKKVGNCAVLTDKEGFEIVLKYFGIDGQATVTAPQVKEVIEPVKKITQKPKNDIDFDVSLDDFM